MATPKFLNVDLDIESGHALTALETELGRRVIVLTGGPVTPGCFLLRLETARQYRNPDDCILAFCSLLEGLSPKGRRAWRFAHKKEFDIGYKAGPVQIASQFSLRAETLQRMSALGATLGITLYHRSVKKPNG